MNLSATFIRRPVATTLLMLGILLFGVIGYWGLAVSDLPNVDFPTIVVTAILPGANPDTMASAVATPLERQFTGIAGLDSLISTNAQGTTSITLQFDLNRDIDGATVDVQTAIAEAMPLLPPGMPNPPSFRKVNPADRPMMFMAITSPTLPLYELDEYAETLMAQRISMVNGVAQVFVFGAQKYAVRVQADPNKLAAKRIGINEITQALQNWNVNLPTGTLSGRDQAFTVQASGQLMNASAYRPMVVSWRNGAPVRLEEVATVIDSVEDDKNASWFYNSQGGQRTVGLAVMRQPGSNTIEVTDNIKRLMPAIQAQIPPAVTVTIRGDRSKTIRESFHDMKFTMALTLTLVIGVIYLFLRNFSATLIPSLALPFSIIGTFGVMHLLDYSLDNLSMMALILSVGLLVDDAIVMLENIVRHIEKGEKPMEAAFRGSREIGFTIVSMTLSLTAVFIPVIFLGGILGRLFREFAITITVAILISGFVSISLTPMLCSRLLRSSQEQRQGPLARLFEWMFEGMLGGYRRSLGWVLRHRPVMLAVFVASLGLSAYLFVKVPKGFIPDADDDQIYVTTEAAQGTSFYQVAEYQQQVADILRRDPNVDGFMSSAGGGGGGPMMAGSNTGRMFVNLKPRKDRELTAREVVEQLRPRMAAFPGMRVFLTLPPSIRIGGRMSKSQYEFTLQGPETEELYRLAPQMEKAVARIPGLLDVTSDLQIRTPRVNIQVDRERAAALQLNTAQIQSALYDAFGPRWASTIYGPGNQYRVLLEILPRYQQHADSLSLLYFKTANGQLVPLDSVAHTFVDAGPQSINHSGQLPSVTISFNLRQGLALGDAVDQIEEVSSQILPGRVSTSFQGTAKAFQDSLKNLSLLLVIAVMVVYIVLGVLYESYVQPLTILSGLPSAGFGALLTLILFKEELNVYAFVGLMMLIGIVKKNAIMQIDAALDLERRDGKSPAQAIYEGCLIRFRPVMMTTMAALLGALPMSFGYGSGGEARRTLGLTVVGGLVFSQTLTLYLTPVVYTYMGGIVEWWRRHIRRAPLAPIATPAR